MDIIMYTKSNCPNCDSAKKLLDAKGLDFMERDVGIPEWRDSLQRIFPDARQMPQIFIKGQRVGGFAGLQAALKQMGI